MVNKEIPIDPVYEDDKVLAFKDINPKAPVHILIIPKKHISTLVDTEESDLETLGHIHYVANQIAREQGVAESGFRIVNNCNKDGGQEVFHLHFHLLGGKRLGSFW